MAITQSTRVLGNALGLTINGTDYWADVKKVEVATESSDKETLTFADAAQGGATSWVLKIEAVVSFDSTAFWEFIWANSGKSVPFIIAPMGNKTAAVGKPHFKGTVTIGAKPGFSSEAGESKGATFEVEWKINGEPTKVTTGSTLGTGNLEEARG